MFTLPFSPPMVGVVVDKVTVGAEPLKPVVSKALFCKAKLLPKFRMPALTVVAPL